MYNNCRFYMLVAKFIFILLIGTHVVLIYKLHSVQKAYKIHKKKTIESYNCWDFFLKKKKSRTLENEG